MFKKYAKTVLIVLSVFTIAGCISVAKVRYVNGCKVEGDYKNGKKNGIWTYYNSCGEKTRQETYQDGVLHGKNCRWDYDGFLLSETNWQAGKRHGKWVKYWITGVVRSEGTFNEGCGKLTGYFPSGKKQFEEEYKNNEKIGKQVYWSENGQNRHEHMINEAGQYDGSYKSYPYELEYKNGVILKIVETVSNDGKTSEKIWEPIFNKGGGLGGFQPKGVEKGVGYTSLGLEFRYDLMHKQYIVSYSDTYGGPCEYMDIPGTAIITAIKPARAGLNNCPRNPVEVLFDFRAADPMRSSKCLRDRHITVGDGKNPSLDFVENRGLKVGQTLHCIQTKIIIGTCSPEFIVFPDIDFSDYAKWCF